MIYIFDIDGTLTPPRGIMDGEFKKFFFNFAENHRVWLITGSDKKKTIQQIGEKIWLTVERAYQCAGNQLYINGTLYNDNGFEPKEYLYTKLEQLLSISSYMFRRGNHIEARPGLINFSTVGRNCTQLEREDYFEWDKVHKEREMFCNEIKNEFPWLDATIGGQISIDIYPKGRDKGQIVKEIDSEFAFFGDNIKPGGNDYPIFQQAKMLKSHKSKFYSVLGWEDTRNLLYSIK